MFVFRHFMISRDISVKHFDLLFKLCFCFVLEQ